MLSSSLTFFLYISSCSKDKWLPPRDTPETGTTMFELQTNLDFGMRNYIVYFSHITSNHVVVTVETQSHS